MQVSRRVQCVGIRLYFGGASPPLAPERDVNVGQVCEVLNC